jgi:hypothetical protein
MRGRRVLALFTTLALAGSVDRAYAQPAAPPAQPAPTSPDEARYDQHMQNGVRLFKARDLLGAITEFEAAYAAAPRASPLINQALSYRELGKYPKAVSILELALSQHRDTMSDEDAEAAKRAIADLRSLFGFVRVEVVPSTFTVTVDGEPIDPADAERPIPVSPGPHEVVISADHFEPHREQVKVASSEEKTIHVALVPSTGHVRLVAKKAETPIEIDGRVVAHGTFDGELGVGPHTLRAVGGTQAGTIRVEPGKTTVIDLGKSPGALPPIPGAAPPPDEPVRGLYGALGGAVLVPFKHPVFFATDTFQDSGASSGGYVELRGGYRVHTYAGFEGMVEYGNVIGPRNGAGYRSYSLTSINVGPLLRLMSPGDVFRFVGTLGGGFAVHMIDYEGLGPLEDQVCPESEQCGSSGVDFFAMTEAGIELDLDGVLIGLAGAFYITGTKGMNDFTKSSTQSVDRSFKEPYANELLPMAGPRLYVGYGFW